MFHLLRSLQTPPSSQGAGRWHLSARGQARAEGGRAARLGAGPRGTGQFQGVAGAPDRVTDPGTGGLCLEGTEATGQDKVVLGRGEPEEGHQRDRAGTPTGSGVEERGGEGRGGGARMPGGVAPRGPSLQPVCDLSVGEGRREALPPPRSPPPPQALGCHPCEKGCGSICKSNCSAPLCPHTPYIGTYSPDAARLGWRGRGRAAPHPAYSTRAKRECGEGAGPGCSPEGFLEEGQRSPHSPASSQRDPRREETQGTRVSAPPLSLPLATQPCGQPAVPPPVQRPPPQDPSCSISGPQTPHWAGLQMLSCPGTKGTKGSWK